MDKSSPVKKNINQPRQRIAIFSYIFLAVLNLVFANPNTLRAEIANFHINAKDLNLASLKSLLDKHSPGVKYDGKISLSADLKVEEGAETISSGVFFSDKVSFSAENILFPIECSKLEGQFAVNLKENVPTITGKANSASVKWGKLYAQNLKADYNLQGKNLIIENGEIKIAGGTARISGNIDFSKNPAVFNLKLNTKGVDIGIISENWGSARPIVGILFSDATLSGELGKPENIFGKAKINIEKGELGKIGLVGRMLTLSPLAALSRDFSLNTFEGSFDISEGYAYTTDAVIKGVEVRITAKGSVGWNRKLDFLLGLYTSSEFWKGTSITRTLGTIIDDFGNVLRKIKLNGTIDNPVFTVLPLGIGESIIEGLERSFKQGQQEEGLK